MERSYNDSFISYFIATKIVASILKGVREQIQENHLRAALYNQQANQVLQLGQDMTNITLLQIFPVPTLVEDQEPERLTVDNFVPYKVKLVQPPLLDGISQAQPLSFFDRSTKMSLRSWRRAVLSSKVVAMTKRKKTPPKSKESEQPEPKIKFIRLPTPEKAQEDNEKDDLLRVQKKINTLEQQRLKEESKILNEQKQKKLQQQKEFTRLLNSNNVTFDYNGSLIKQKPASISEIYHEIQVDNSYDLEKRNSQIESLSIPKQKIFELKTGTYYKNINNVYNNNGERQISMVPKIKVSEGVKLFAYDEYGTQEVVDNQNLDKTIKTLTYSSYMDFCKQRQFDIANYLEAYHTNILKSLTDQSQFSLLISDKSSEKQTISSEFKSDFKSLNPHSRLQVLISNNELNSSIISSDPVSLPKIDKTSRLSVPKKRDRSCQRKYSQNDCSVILEQARGEFRLKQYSPFVSPNKRKFSLDQMK